MNDFRWTPHSEIHCRLAQPQAMKASGYSHIDTSLVKSFVGILKTAVQYSRLTAAGSFDGADYRYKGTTDGKELEQSLEQIVFWSFMV